MRKSATVRILDWDFVLSEVDRHLIAHLARRVIGAFGDDVRSFRFEMLLKHDRQLEPYYEAKCHTELASGKVLETSVVSAEKNKLIGTFGSRLRTDLKQRLTFESGIAFRAYCWARRELTRLLDVAAKKREPASQQHCQTS